MFAVRPGAAGDISLGKEESSNAYVAWSQPRAGTYLPTPLAYEGGIYTLTETGILSRFGPMYHAERLGGALSLVAMKVPEPAFERVVAQVNAFPEVAHNYARDHVLNLWFVLATEKPERKAEVLSEIEAVTGLPVHDMPKITEYFVGLKLTV